jgi:HEAT repeat protein
MKGRLMLRFSPSMKASFLLALVLPLAIVSAQAKLQAQTSSDPQKTVQTPNNDPDGEIVGDQPSVPKTPAQLQDEAWKLLSTAAADPKHTDTRIQALAALGQMGANPRSLKLIQAAMQDRDVDVQTAAILAAGQTKATTIVPAIRRQLDSKEPQVAYTAALTLWKIGDRSGEDILAAVIDGERRASATLINGTEHDIDKTLHSPSELAKIGVIQGAGLLLGPFGFGITAYEYIKKNGGDSARVNAIEALSQEKSDAIRKVLLAALGDKDFGVRAAAAKALSTYHQPELSAAIAKLFDDPKQPVRLTASASYLISTRASPESPKPNEQRTARSTRR